MTYISIKYATSVDVIRAIYTYKAGTPTKVLKLYWSHSSIAHYIIQKNMKKLRELNEVRKSGLRLIL